VALTADIYDYDAVTRDGLADPCAEILGLLPRQVNECLELDE
jgi:hypothetical protein